MKNLTLVELMIIVSVLGIFLAVAIPLYNDHIDKKNGNLTSAERQRANSAKDITFIEKCHEGKAYLFWSNGSVTPKLSGLGNGIASC